MAKEILFNIDARDQLKKGVDALALSLITHLRAHETPEHLVCRLLLEKKKMKSSRNITLTNKSQNNLVKSPKYALTVSKHSK